MKNVSFTTTVLAITGLLCYCLWHANVQDLFLACIIFIACPVAETLLLFRWIDEKAAMNQLYHPELGSKEDHAFVNPALQSPVAKSVEPVSNNLPGCSISQN